MLNICFICIFKILQHNMRLTLKASEIHLLNPGQKNNNLSNIPPSLTHLLHYLPLQDYPFLILEVDRT